MRAQLFYYPETSAPLIHVACISNPETPSHTHTSRKAVSDRSNDVTVSRVVAVIRGV